MSQAQSCLIDTENAACPHPEKIVTAEIIHAVLSHYKDGSYEVARFSVKPATKPGENYGSVLYAVVFHLCKKENSEITEELHVMLKVVPKSQFGKRFAKLVKSFVKEVNMYEKILPTMEKFQREKCLSESEITNCWPTFYGGNENSFVIMRNLKVDGYRIANRQTGLDFEHSKIVLEEMARFHAVSYAMFGGNRDLILKEYPCLEEVMFGENPPFLFKIVSKALVKQQAKRWERVYRESETESNGNPGKTIISKQKRITKIICDLLAKNKWAVVGHGDCWTNNYLFRYNPETGKPIEVKFIDFQQSRASSIMSDIQYFLHTSPQIDLLNEREKELEQIYFDEFTRFAERLGVNVDAEGLTRENFEEELNEFRVFGVIIGLMMVGATCADSEDIPDVENFKIMDMIKGQNTMFDNMMNDLGKAKIRNLLAVQFPKSPHLREMDNGHHHSRKTCVIL